MNKEKKLQEEIKPRAWECRCCGMLVFNSVKPNNCSCGNRSTYFENSQVTSLAERRYTQAKQECENEWLNKLLPEQVEVSVKEAKKEVLGEAMKIINKKIDDANDDEKNNLEPCTNIKPSVFFMRLISDLEEIKKKLEELEK